MSFALACARAWQSVADFLLPRQCCGCGERLIELRQLVCDTCSMSIAPLLQPICVKCGCPDARIKTENICANCPPGKTWFARARGVAAFSGVAQVVVARLKYHRRIEYAALMAEAIGESYAKDNGGGADVVVPVPLHSSRRRERGFNQSALIARHFAEFHGIPVTEKALLRIKPTPSQTRMKKRQRRENVSGAFSCRRPAEIAGRRVLLIDDVYTTGSTVNECAKVLMEAGAESVQVLSYARAVLD